MPPRTWRPMLLWTAAILAAAALAGSLGSLTAAFLEARSAVIEHHAARAAPDTIGRLGGPDRALFKLRLYLWAPKRLAPERWLAVYLLRDCGPKAVPALIAATRDSDPKVRQWAAVALCAIGPDGAAAVPALIRNLGDADQSVCWSTTHALAAIGPKAKASIPALIEQLGHTDKQLRGLAVFALGRIGPEARDALPALRKLVADEDLRFRLDVPAALAEISVDGEQGLPALIRMLEAGGGLERAWTPDAREETPARAADEDAVLRTRAAMRLGGIGPKAKLAAPALEKALADPDARVRVQAALGLARVNPAAMGKAVAALQEHLLSNEDWVRSAAIEALGEIGPEARAAVPMLEKLAKDDVRQGSFAAHALKRIRGKEREPRE